MDPRRITQDDLVEGFVVHERCGGWGCIGCGGEGAVERKEQQ